MGSMLTTFVKPTPQPRIINLLVPVNRLVNLKGISFLKWIPFVKKLPLIRGLCDIPKINLSVADENKLRSYINSDCVSFIAPNHPEFFTDWMLDKEISARVAPLMASWATHDIVNGMGKGMQEFWLKNNLIAQIPGTGNKEAKDYSVAHAIAGHGVLLHPEGHVGWHSDKIAPLFSGIFEMAYQAYEQTHGEKPIYILPVVWKLSFNKNVSKELHKEFNYIEKELHFSSSSSLDLNARLYQLFFSIFQNIALKHSIAFENLENHTSIISIQKFIIQQLSLQIASKFQYELTGNIELDLKQMNKLFKNQYHLSPDITGEYNKNETHRLIKIMLRDLGNLQDFNFDYYSDSDQISQENIAELLKKIRILFCTKGIKNIFHKFVPIPVSSRTAYIEVPEVICLNDLIKTNNLKDQIKITVLNHMQKNMQNQLDSINQNLLAQHRVYRYKNTLI